MEIKSPKQVDLLYALFLGRLPENNFVRHENLDRPILDLVNAMVMSDEFRHSILERFLVHGTLPHKALPLSLLPEALALTAATGLAKPVNGLAEADWKWALGRILSQSPHRNMLEAMYGEDARKLIEKLGGDPRTPAEHNSTAPTIMPADLAWGAEIVAQTICRGWLIDRAHPDAPLHVRLRINGGTVKTMLADEFRRDVQDHYGGTGLCGFTLRLDQLPGISQLSRASIEISELGSGTILVPDYTVELSSAPSLSLEVELREEVRRVREILDHLKGQLAKIPLDRPNPLTTLFRPYNVIDQNVLELRRYLDKLYDQAIRITQDLPEYVRRNSWALPFYDTIRSSINLVIDPPDTELSCTFSVLIFGAPTGSADAAARTLASILNQTLKPAEIFVLLPEQAQLDHVPSFATGTAIVIVPLTDGETAAQVAHNIATRATGLYLLIIDAGVTLMPDGLAWSAVTIHHTGALIVYTDQENVSQKEDGRKQFLPIFLPAFDYDLLLQRNYIGTTFFIRRETFLSLGRLNTDPMLDPHHDLLLRAAATFGEAAFVHLSLILLCRCVDVGSQGKSAPAPAPVIRTVQQHLDSTNCDAKAVKHADPTGRGVPGAIRVDWGPESIADRISVIIPTRDRADLVFALLSSLKRHTALAENLEIIVVVSGKIQPQLQFTFSEISSLFDQVKISYHDKNFNWGAINNTAVKELSSGGIIVFLNDDMICLTDGWDNRLRGQLARPQIGVVGGRLLYPNGTIQHAGITFCGRGATAHEAAGDPPDHGLYLDRTLLVHQIGAVTGAFLACRRPLFDELGGFDAERYAVTSSDADFCVRTRIRGRKVIYDPSLTWIHYESASRGHDSQDYKRQSRAEAEQERWASRFSEKDLIDLSLNPHLAHSNRPFETFHRVTHADLWLWLDVQRDRCKSRSDC